MNTYIVTHTTTIVRTYHVAREDKIKAKVAVECGGLGHVESKEGVELKDFKETIVVKVGRTLTEEELVGQVRAAEAILEGLGDVEVTTLLRAAGIVPAKYDFERLQQLTQQLRR